jgi:hypothetical protein
MCYTPGASLTAFVVNVIFSLLLIRTQNKQLQTLAYFFLFVGTMQLWDYIFWTNSSNTCVNQTTTKIAAVWNHLQPIVLALCIIYILKTPIKKESRIILCTYALAALIYTLSIWKKLGGTAKTTESGDALEWRWNHFDGAKIVYALFLASLVILAWQHFDTPWIKISTSILFIASFAFSVYKYKITANTGRMWCYLAAFAPLLYYFISQLKK